MPEMHLLDESEEKMGRSDEYLLQMALGGDGASFGALAQRWEKRIHGFIRRYVGNSEEARDLTQDTFAKAFQNLDRLVDPGRFSSWLYKIALNECRMRFRKEKGTHRIPWEESQAESRRSERVEENPESRLESVQRVDRLKEVFKDLPKEQKEVILMKEFQGLKFHEISEILGVPLSTAKSRMYLGLKTLRKLMEGRQ
jgi:RNA polymerase sigma-70 factor (ECF subfamily)